MDEGCVYLASVSGPCKEGGRPRAGEGRGGGGGGGALAPTSYASLGQGYWLTSLPASVPAADRFPWVELEVSWASILNTVRKGQTCSRTSVYANSQQSTAPRTQSSCIMGAVNPIPPHLQVHPPVLAPSGIAGVNTRTHAGRFHSTGGSGAALISPGDLTAWIIFYSSLVSPSVSPRLRWQDGWRVIAGPPLAGPPLAVSPASHVRTAWPRCLVSGGAARNKNQLAS